MGKLMKDATFSLASAKYTAGDFGSMVRENVSEATIKVRMGTENAMGVVRIYCSFSSILSFFVLAFRQL
jgi:vacuolar-type H+-ATPase subunit D/Vma8